MQRLLERAAVGRRWDELKRRYQQARAELVLVAPIQIIALIRRTDDFFGRWQDERGDNMRRKWSQLSQELRITAQATLGEARGWPYRAAEPPINAKQQEPTHRRTGQGAKRSLLLSRDRQ